MAPLNLPSIATPGLLSFLRNHPRLPKHSWYFTAAVTLSVINRPDEIPNVFKYVLDHGEGPTESAKPSRDEALRIARRVRESLIKSAAIAGLPKVSVSPIAKLIGAIKLY